MAPQMVEPGAQHPYSQPLRNPYLNPAHPIFQPLHIPHGLLLLSFSVPQAAEGSGLSFTFVRQISLL